MADERPLLWREQFFARDEDLTARFVQRTNGRIYQGAAFLLSRTGDSWLWGVVCALTIWRYGRIGWLLLLNLLITAAVIALLKGVFRRQRPHTSGKEIGSDKYSFPSGHAARTGAMATVLALAYPQWAWLCLLWAVVVALSRVIRSRHYLADVAAGLLLGGLSSFFIYVIWLGMST